MAESKLHHFDVELCQYALNNIRRHLGEPAFSAYVAEQLDPPVLTYLHSLDGDDPASLLLTDQNFEVLAATFGTGPFEFDRPWESHEPLHRRNVNCVREIRDGLASPYAEAWGVASVSFAERLEDQRTRLGAGIEIVHEWVREIRRLLRAMGATSFLPHPEGSSPTPACQVPPTDTIKPASLSEGERLQAMIAETQTLQREVRDLLVSQRTVKDFYSTAEVSTLLDKAEFTVREWCRHGRVRAEKQGSGRGKHQSWVISHAELQRLQRDGLLPVSESP